MKLSSRLLSMVLILISFVYGNCTENNQTSAEPKPIEMMAKTLYLTKSYQTFLWNNCKSIGETCLIPEACCTMKCIKGIEKCFF